MLLGARQFFKRRGAALPYDAEVEYVETDGIGAYVNTGITLTYQSIINVRFKVISVPSTASTGLVYNPVFGAAASSNVLNGSNFMLVAAVGAGTFRPSQPNIASGATPPSYDNNIHMVSLASGVFTFDGSNIGANTISASRVIGKLCMGSRGEFEAATLPEYGYTQSRFFSCQIYTNGVLTFDGIPVRKDGNGYLYDKVSGNIFGNSGASGTAVNPGPDKS